MEKNLPELKMPPRSRKAPPPCRRPFRQPQLRRLTTAFLALTLTVFALLPTSVQPQQQDCGDAQFNYSSCMGSNTFSKCLSCVSAGLFRTDFNGLDCPASTERTCHILQDTNCSQSCQNQDKCRNESSSWVSCLANVPNCTIQCTAEPTAAPHGGGGGTSGGAVLSAVGGTGWWTVSTAAFLVATGSAWVLGC